MHPATATFERIEIQISLRKLKCKYLFIPSCTSYKLKHCFCSVISRHTVQMHLRRSLHKLPFAKLLPVLHFPSFQKFNLPVSVSQRFSFFSFSSFLKQPMDLPRNVFSSFTKTALSLSPRHPLTVLGLPSYRTLFSRAGMPSSRPYKRATHSNSLPAALSRRFTLSRFVDVSPISFSGSLDRSPSRNATYSPAFPPLHKTLPTISLSAPLRQPALQQNSNQDAFLTLL